MSPDSPDGFLSRWSRRKALVRQGDVPPEPAPVVAPAAAAAPAAEQVPVPAPAAAYEPPPALTLDDVARLAPGADIRRFVAADVDPAVKNAALKKLFADPHYNVMDGLDTYIDDYGKPDPIPAAMLRQMAQSHALGLFADEQQADVPTAAGASPDGAAPVDAAQSPSKASAAIADDQDAAVRLQPLDAAGPNSDPGGTGQDAGRER